MENIIITKLKNNAGETIGETLVALLISSLSLVMLAGAISASVRVVTKSKEKMNNYYTANNNVEEKLDAGKEITIQLGDNTLTVKSYINGEYNDKPVVSYRISDSSGG